MRIIPLILLVALPLVLRGQSRREAPQLSGIVNLPGFKKAVFEFGSDCCNTPRFDVLAEGQGDEDLRVIKILPERATVEASINATQAPITLTLSVESNRVSSERLSIELANCSLYSLLELLGEFNGRTLLYSPFLARSNFWVTGSVTDLNGAAKLLERVLAERNIVTVADGDVFMAVVPKEQASKLKLHAPARASRSSATNNVSKDKSDSRDFPTGAIDFRGADVNQVMDIYSALVGGRFDRGAARPQPVQPFFFLRSRSPLTEEEGVYAFEILLSWQGIKMVRGADGMVRAVPVPKE